MNQWFTLALNLVCLGIGQFAASEILDDAAKLWGWSEAQAHLVMKVLLFVQGFAQTVLTQVAHFYNPDGSKAAGKQPEGGE